MSVCMLQNLEIVVWSPTLNALFRALLFGFELSWDKKCVNSVQSKRLWEGLSQEAVVIAITTSNQLKRRQ